MNREQALELLRAGPEGTQKWNEWRKKEEALSRVIKAVFHDKYPKRVDLNRANLSRVNLTGSDFTHVDLVSADLSGANLPVSDFTRADLTDANLAGAVLVGAVLTNATLVGAVLTGVDLEAAELASADLTGARWNELTQWPAGFVPPANAIFLDEDGDVAPPPGRKTSDT